MKINKHISRAVSVMLSFAMALGGVIPAHAAEVTVSESLLEETGLAGPVLEEADGEETESGLEAYADSESRYEQIEVNYSQASRYSVTIPKTITLGTDKRSPYSIKVEGDIVANKQVCVVPVDGIADTEVFDFYMSDQIAGSTKKDVAAEISQSKFYWDHEEAARGYEETDNHIVAEGLSAGKWKGTFQMEISMRTDPSHIHNYVGEVTKEPTCTEAGEKTYTCDCGDSYTESIDPTGHHYENGECTNCGEKDPDHEHSYTEEITKQPTCTEEGEKTYTCICGDSYTEKIPATGHHFVDGECEDCGEKDPIAHTHSYKEEVTKEPTCTEAGEKTYTCICGDSYTEEIPATGHHYENGTCTDCGEKDPDAFEKIKVGDTETRVIAGQTLEFICIDDAYVDATGAPVGALFIAKDYFPTNVLTLTKYEPEWALTNARGVLNGEKSDLTDLITVNTTVSKRYTKQNTAAKYDMGTIDKYGDPVEAGHTETTDKVFILSLEEAVRYNKVMINDREISVMWDLNCDGTVELNKFEKNRGGYYLRTAYQNPTDGYYLIWWDGQVSSSSAYAGVRPCYVKDNNLHKHNYVGSITKEPTCTEDGEKTFTCVCGHSYTETIPATGHNYVDGVCENCGKKEPVIKVGETETRVIAGQTLEFICIDNAYVDATGKEVGALFIAKDFISGSILSMGTKYQSAFIKDWATNGVRSTLNGDTSDLTDLISVDTTIINAYSENKYTKNYDVETIASYGVASKYGAASTEDKVFVLSLEEAIKYNKVIVNGKEISAMWDLDCDGTIEFNVSSQGRIGYYLRTPISGTARSIYCICYDGSVLTGYNNSIGIRPCYVRENDKPICKHNYIGNVTKQPTCTEAGETTYICSNCGDSYTEEIAKTEHNYENNICTECGKEYDPYEFAPYGYLEDWDYTLDNTNDIVTLNYYIGTKTDVIVYANYSIGNKTYKTELSSNPYGTNVGNNVSYMFCANPYDVKLRDNNKNIKSIKFSKNIDTSNVTDMSYMFFGCSSLTSLDLSSFDTGNVTNMKYMFDGCSGLTSLNMSSFDTSKVTDMNHMFADCWNSNFRSLDVSNFDTSNVTNMGYMFYNCKYVTNFNLRNFDTGNVTNMSHMFNGCWGDPDTYSLSIDVSSFDTSKVTDMSYMFSGCEYLKSINLSSFNTSNVKNMKYMFNCCDLRSLNLSNFDTSNVTDMSFMFNHCYKLGNINLSSFDTSNVTDMSYMFCRSFEDCDPNSLDLTSFNTSKVKNMKGMFSGCYNLNAVYVTNGKWVTSQATTTDMFLNCDMTKSVTYK